MRNRAKCRLCNSIIESLTDKDFITCQCYEISISGGKDSFHAQANDFKNFLRIDDDDKEIEVTYQESANVKPLDNEEYPKPSKKEMIFMLEEMARNIEKLPPHAMLAPINHYDFCSLMILLSSLFRAED